MAIRVSPLALVYIAMIMTNNMCLSFVEVSYYQIARSLSILFSVIFSKLLLGKSTSNPVLVSCGIVFVGYVLSTKGEMNFSLQGAVYGLISSIFVALNGIVVSKTLSSTNNDTWLLMLHNTILSIVLMIPFLVVFELQAMLLNSRIMSPTVILFVGLSGIFGFLINIAMYLQIKYTSALTNTISG